MTTIDLRNTVREYINTADIRLLKMMKALAESYQSGEDEFELSEVDYELVDKRRASHLKGESASFTWDEVKQEVRKSTQ